MKSDNDRQHAGNRASVIFPEDRANDIPKKDAREDARIAHKPHASRIKSDRNY